MNIRRKMNIKMKIGLNNDIQIGYSDFLLKIIKTKNTEPIRISASIIASRNIQYISNLSFISAAIAFCDPSW